MQLLKIYSPQPTPPTDNPTDTPTTPSIHLPKAKESIGAIARLAHVDGRAMTVNVEYNQLDPLLRATIAPEGDVNDPATGGGDGIRGLRLEAGGDMAAVRCDLDRSTPPVSHFPPPGFSPFPGNINQLVIKLDSYVHQLAATGATDIPRSQGLLAARSHPTAHQHDNHRHCETQQTHPPDPPPPQAASSPSSSTPSTRTPPRPPSSPRRGWSA